MLKLNDSNKQDNNYCLSHNNFISQLLQCSPFTSSTMYRAICVSPRHSARQRLTLLELFRTNCYIAIHISHHDNMRNFHIITKVFFILQNQRNEQRHVE